MQSYDSILSTVVHSFSITIPIQRRQPQHRPQPSPPPSHHPLLLLGGTTTTAKPTALFGGTGVAKGYTWNEEQHEIEVKVSVPEGTKTADVRFVATSKSVHLSLRSNGGGEEELLLLDGKRALRGPIDADGTFWTIADGETTSSAETADSSSSSSSSKKSREITVTIEKFQSIPEDQFEVYEYDWGGVYPNDEDEVLSKNYKEAEPLDIREYAASLGVDIDNIDMTKVDKTMFTSGLNMTKAGMDELVNKGYATEVTAQADGTESTETGQGQQVPFRRFGDAVGDDEIRDAEILDADDASDDDDAASAPGIPFLDTPSPWDSAAELAELPEEVQGAKKQDTVMASASESTSTPTTQKTSSTATTTADTTARKSTQPKDPIDSLTVAKLKDILRKENLKVTGNKKELQDRLKAHVNSIVTKNKDE